jgi:hypothetical protein
MLNLKGQKMSKSPSKLEASLKAARIALANAKLEVQRLAVGVKVEREQKRAEKQVAKEAKAAAAQVKREAAIAKTQARLQKLLEKQAAPVGVKALKANRKPGKAVVYGAEDNAIAKAIMDRKAKASA